ncbi:MAG TPA: glycosyltransferase [Thermoanaerobaculaceae bacterium]|nr:glycosyltransferase [Thermoanaerobaculaceae bacterium]
MSLILLAVLVVLGLLATAVMAVAQRRLLRSPTPATDHFPPVSILKPMRGADPGLETNLESFLVLDYPAYEVLFGVDDPADPAVAVARRVAARHPEVPSRVVIDPRRVGANPKVNNLANLLPHARHEVLLVSDSNVRVRPGYLADLVARLAQPGVGLVSSPFRGTGASGLGGQLEALQLNTFVMGGVAALSGLLGGVCVVGKSMLLRAPVLHALGGFRFLADYLAEDQVCGEEVARLGLRTVVSGHLIDNRLGRVSVRAFLDRHLRWARIRRRMSPAGYLGELLLNPTFVALVGVALQPSPATLALFAGTAVVKGLLAVAAERTAGLRPRLAATLALSILRDLLVGLTWAIPLADASVRWRGRRFLVGPRTLLVPSPALAPEPAPAAEPLPDGAAAA